MDPNRIIIAIFEFAVLLFSLSLHEAAHAWMASRLGDPTARMLGRVTLNPIKHIDLWGTIILPAIMLFIGPGFLFGWAKPTPVTTANFKNITRDDILTTIAGPGSNILAAIGATLVLLILSRSSLTGAAIVHQIAATGQVGDTLLASSPTLVPLVLLFYLAVVLNLILAAFNLLPLPPLDGSHVFRHFLPYKALRIYDQLGIVSLLLIFLVGGRVIGVIVSPALLLLRRVLLAF
ncbi:MAG TPA: site-2 protease family protein [Acidobacteriaceae bacterium]|jgi:Zn-dependent protease|nr:site-2 protease family protein [Acidobacteriaceae bacterium]